MILISINNVIEKARTAFRARRLELNLTQKGLSERSGVKLATLRQFERTGKLSFESLVKLSLVLDYLEKLHTAFDPITEPYKTLEDVLKPEAKTRQRGRIK